MTSFRNSVNVTEILSTRTAQGRIGHYRTREPGTLMGCLTGAAGLSPSEASWLLYLGAVYVDRRRAVTDCPLSAGQYVRVHFDPRRFMVGHIDWTETIVHEDRDFIVVNKPSGVPVHPTVDNRVENVLCQVGDLFFDSLRITQRLDVEVSGLLIIARTREFQRYFNRLLAERKVHKTYRALVNDVPAISRYVHYMEPTLRGPKTVTGSIRPDWLECALRIVNVNPFLPFDGKPVFELEIELETGRTHQIRAQLSAIGCPIMGDKLYGSRARFKMYGRAWPGIALCSAETAWHGESGREWSFTLHPPWVY